MRVTHILSAEVLFAYQNASDGSFVATGATLLPNALYHCRRWVAGSGYFSVDLYGSELTPA